MSAAEHDVAIYSPSAAAFYDRARVEPGLGGGGAELQTTLLAAGLAERGLRVAHIVFPVAELKPAHRPGLDVVQRRAHQGGRGPAGYPLETAAVWSAMREARAATYVVRGSGGHVVPAAAFCATHRRRFVFASSNDLDFDFERSDRTAALWRAYRVALRRADAIVVQSSQQLELARGRLGSAGRIELIPSFAELAEAAKDRPEAFLWVGRLVDYKEPFRYLDLARSLPEARFRMVGVVTNETSSAFVERVRDEARQLPNLELLDPRPRAELLPLLRRAVAIVATSRAEGMPNVFLEAWAMGIPALTLHFDPDGVVSEHGLGVSAGDDWDSFVAGADSLWEAGESLRERFAEAARDYVEAVHGPAAVADRWLALLKELRGRRR